MHKDSAPNAMQLQAIETVAALARESGSDWIFISDIDDTLVISFPFLLDTLNQWFRDHDPSWTDLSIDEILAAPTHRLEDTRAREEAQSLGIDFLNLWSQICSNPESLGQMDPVPGIYPFLQELSELGIPLVGYLTARPEAIYPATDLHLDSLSLPRVPIFGPGRNGINTPAEKTELLAALLEVLPPNIRILFADDHINTTVTVKESLGDRVEVLAIASPRNQAERQKLEELNIPYGTFDEHIVFVQSLVAAK